MKRLAAFICAGALLTPCAAEAKIGVAVGPHTGISNPTTAHIGPVYYTPGDGNSPAKQAGEAATAPTELSQFLSSEQHKKKKVDCEFLHARYIGRHGLDTPRPLAGMHGCAKWARDQAYWSSKPQITSVGNAIFYAVHNTILPW